MKSYDIIGYTYKADIYCPPCVVNEVLNDYNLHSTILDYISWDAGLNRLAKRVGIDYSDSYSYDSDSFPKVIFADQDENDSCCICGERLID